MARELNFTGGQVDLKVNVGSEISFPVQLTGGGVNIDKTGRSYVAEVKRTPSTTDVLLSFTITPGAAGTDPLTLSASFDDIPTGVHHWDLWEQAASGDDRQLLAGRVHVVDRVVTAP